MASGNQPLRRRLQSVKLIRDSGLGLTIEAGLKKCSLSDSARLHGGSGPVEYR
jgi:hypothetical protein